MGPLRTDKKTPLIKACSRGANLLRHVSGAGVWPSLGRQDAEGCVGAGESPLPQELQSAPHTQALLLHGQMVSALYVPVPRICTPASNRGYRDALFQAAP